MITKSGVDLSLVLNEELWEEIKARNQAVVLCRMTDMGDKTEEYELNYSGGKFICLGLIESISMLLKKRISKEADE